MKKILLVDGNKDTCKAMMKTFTGSDYQVITEDDGYLALEMLNIGKVDLVICGTNLQNMEGAEFLSIVRKQYPDVVRIIMSAHAEEAVAFKAMLQNIAGFYILKPWNDEKLREYIGQIFETKAILKSKDLMLLIQDVDELPTIERSYQKILGMIEKDANTTDISCEIEKDFAISTKLLQMANSAYYGLQTGSIKHATVYIGLYNLKSLIYSTSIIHSLDHVSAQHRESITDLWTHALMTSKLFHFIYGDMMNKKLSELASSAALLHNIGSLILIQNHIKEYAKVISASNCKELNLLELEKQYFQVTHQEAGGYLVSWWELPFPIVEAALYHHKPLDPVVINKEVVCAVHLAQHYAWQFMGQPATTEFFPEVFDVLGIRREDFEASVNWRKWN
ncbi:MAG: HDOD domain-containing protein [Eubacteriales bacterium]|nr:HDOD domain-containing protein [Eubacteriales bacterium]